MRWNQVSYDPRSYESKLSNVEPSKIQDFNEVWTRDLAIPVRGSNQLSYAASDVTWFHIRSSI